MGRAGDPTARRCGGGVGRPLGGIGGGLSTNDCLICPGEKGGVGASGRFEDCRGRGVDPFEVDV